MKALLVCCFALIATRGISQEKDIHIQMGIEKRIYLIFESNVHKVDWAEVDSVAIKYEENKVIIQSRADDISDSNVLVETDDGYNYSFILGSVINPPKVTYVITPAMAFYRSTRFEKKLGTSEIKESVGSPQGGTENQSTSSEIKSLCKQIEVQSTDATGLAKVDKRMTIFVGGIYVHQDKLFFKVLLQNESTVAYDIDLISFAIEQGAGNVKKTAVEKPKFKDPEYILNGEDKKIVRGKVSVFVFVFEKFTFDKKETLFCEVWEAGGKRKIRLPIPLNKILNAKTI